MRNEWHIRFTALDKLTQVRTYSSWRGSKSLSTSLPNCFSFTFFIPFYCEIPMLSVYWHYLNMWLIWIIWGVVGYKRIIMAVFSYLLKVCAAYNIYSIKCNIRVQWSNWARILPTICKLRPLRWVFRWIQFYTRLQHTQHLNYLGTLYFGIITFLTKILKIFGSNVTP